jgi:hypothetical protein
MRTAEGYPGLHSYNALSNYELLEVRGSKIALDHAKVDYCYPTIHLPYTSQSNTADAYLSLGSRWSACIPSRRLVRRRRYKEIRKCKNKRQKARLDIAEIAGSNQDSLHISFASSWLLARYFD